MKFFIVSVILFVILFFPIPIVIKFYYENKTFSLYIWKFKLFKNTINSIAKNIIQNFNTKETSNIKELKNKIEKKKKFSFDFKKLISKLHSNPFKAKFKLNYTLDYSLEDAAAEAITYGLLWDINATLIVLLDSFFKFVPEKCSINANFKNLNFINFASKSILSINLGQIIFILILLLSCIRRCPNKGVSYGK